MKWKKKPPYTGPGEQQNPTGKKDHQPGKRTGFGVGECNNLPAAKGGSPEEKGFQEKEVTGGEGG